MHKFPSGSKSVTALSCCQIQTVWIVIVPNVRWRTFWLRQWICDRTDTDSLDDNIVPNLRLRTFRNWSVRATLARASQFDNPLPLPLREAKAGKNLNEEIIRLLLTGIGKRCSQTISNSLLILTLKIQTKSVYNQQDRFNPTSRCIQSTVCQQAKQSFHPVRKT